MYIKGLFSWTENESKVLAVKYTNQARRMYTKRDLLDKEPKKPKLTDINNGKTIYIPDGDTAPVRRRLYSAIPKDDTLGILIWDGGTKDVKSCPSQIATLEIVEYGGYDDPVTPCNYTAKSVKPNGYSKKVIVDYSGVTFEEPSVKLDASVATAATINSALNAAAKTVVLTGNTTLTLNAAVTVPAGKTLKVGDKVTVTSASTANTVNVAGDVVVEEGGAFKIANGAYTVDAGSGLVLLDVDDETTEGGKLTDSGKVVIGATEISGGAAGWQAVGNGAITINRDGDAAVSIWGKTTLKGGAGATITQKAGNGNVLNIGSNDNNTDANALKLDLGGTATTADAAIILVSGADPGKIAIPKKTSVITLASGIGGNNIGGVATITIGGKSVVSATFAVGDYQVSGGKLVKIGGTTVGGSITASTAGSADVTIDSTQAVTGADGT